MLSFLRPSSRSRRSQLVASMALAILLLFQICVFTSTAARIVNPSHHDAAGHSSDPDSSISSSSSSSSSKDKVDYRGMSKTEHFRRYFSAPPPPPPPSSDSSAVVVAGGGFEESKRKVPSCPDPLHN